jgi:hypothetical protein
MIRKKYLPFITDIKELIHSNNFKLKFLKDREEYKAKKQAVQVIEE